MNHLKKRTEFLKRDTHNGIVQPSKIWLNNKNWNRCQNNMAFLLTPSNWFRRKNRRLTKHRPILTQMLDRKSLIKSFKNIVNFRKLSDSNFCSGKNPLYIWLIWLRISRQTPLDRHQLRDNSWAEINYKTKSWNWPNWYQNLLRSNRLKSSEKVIQNWSNLWRKWPLLWYTNKVWLVLK